MGDAVTAQCAPPTHCHSTQLHSMAAHTPHCIAPHHINLPTPDTACSHSNPRRVVMVPLRPPFACFLLLCILVASAVPHALSWDVPELPDFLSLTYATHPIRHMMQLPLSLTVVPPHIHFSKASTHLSYTVLMLDPDAPSASQPTQAHWLHYQHINLPGASILPPIAFATTASAPRSPSSTIVASYAPPSPPPNSGWHRYVVLLYAQSGPIPTPPADATTAAEDTRRAKFDLERWIRDREAEGVTLTLAAGIVFSVMGPERPDAPPHSPDREKLDTQPSRDELR